MTSLAPWPETQPAWLQAWTIWRFQNKPLPKPTIIPKVVPAWSWSFLQWIEWKRKGSPVGSRPADAPYPIPSGKYPWGVLKAVNIAAPPKPVPPAPPPTPPPLPIPTNSFKLPLPIAWTAWGWTNDSFYRDTPEVAAQQFKDSGFGTVAVQGGQATSEQCQILHDHGLKVAMWGIADSQDAQWLSEYNADGYIPQIEGPGQYDAAIASLQAGVGAGLSLSTVTTLFGLGPYTSRSDGSRTTPGVEALIAAGCTHAFTECYGEAGIHYADIPAMMDSTTRLTGFYHANPLVGVYWGWHLSAYDLSAWGRQFGIYLTESMDASVWDEVRAA